MPDNDYITCHIMGGLGNQLFQIFTTIAYSLEHNRKFLFTYSEYVKNRQTYWNTFLKPISIFTTMHPVHNKTNYSLTYSAKLFREKGFNYSPIPKFSLYDTIVLYGYYQSYLYFRGQQENIFRMINLRAQQNSIREEYPHYFVRSTADGKIISMHFRLGDYKGLPDYHNILPSTYYKNALSKMLEFTATAKIRVLYFCEKQDEESVKTQISYLQMSFPSCEFVKVDDDVPDYKQMLIMSLCDHNIIANSTFSWWGAYLNQNVGKKVCYPSQWFGPLLVDQNKIFDFIPPEWICIGI